LPNLETRLKVEMLEQNSACDENLLEVVSARLKGTPAIIISEFGWDT